MKSRNITIIIVTYNSQDQIESCLKSIDKQGIQADILIIDNCSTDETWQKLQTLKQPNITLIKNKTNNGFAKAVNQGIRYSNKNFKNNLFLLLNPDATLDKDCLKNITNTIELNPRVGLCSPVIKNPLNREVIFQKGQIDWLKMRTSHSALPETSLDYLTGCCLLIKKAVTDKLEGFDERFFLYFEDADFSLRARREGFQIKTISNAICFHEESKSSDSATKTYFLVKNGLIFFYKHFSLPIRFFYFWPIFTLRLLYHSLISHKKPVIRGLKDFLSKR